MRFAAALLLVISCSSNDIPPGVRVLEPGEMLERIDSIFMFDRGSGAEIDHLPSEVGHSIHLGAQVFWKEDQEPEAYALIWNLKSCVDGNIGLCELHKKHIHVEMHTGKVIIVNPLPIGMRYEVSLGIAIGRIDKIEEA